jgi:cell division initiation protein
MTELTPNDLVNKQFRVVLRGYAQDEVEEFLQEAADTLYHALEEAQRLRAQAAELKARVEQYQHTEALIQSTLLTAERAAEDVRANARREAELLQREANERLQTERATLETLRQHRLRIITEMRAVLATHYSLLDAEEARLQADHGGRPGGEQG